ncbi:MAG: DNA primase, partial [Candidatus Binatia bacterium]
FPEALERLAREFGIELPRRPEERRRDEGKERLLELNARAAEYFQRCLWHERMGAAARDYLVKRGIREDTARRFALGYAPAEGLARALEAAKVPPALPETLGLIGKSRQGGWYDRFRERLMFPITGLDGKVIAFGGRLLGEGRAGQPKYLNSPESAVFQKRRSLFGLAAAREAIRAKDRAIVVEGYMDAIALAQAGIENVVAPLGTALTADQIRQLRRFTDSIAVFFDGDAAGRAAAARSFPVFAEVGLFADAAFLPDGHDPDSFVRESGAEGVEALLTRSSPLVDHYLRTLAPPDAPLAGRMRAAQSVAELIGRIRNPIFSGLLARRAAEIYGIAEEQLLKGGRISAPAAPPAAPAAKPAAAGISTQEALLIELLIVHPGLRDTVRDSAGGLLDSEEARALLARILGEDFDASALLEELPLPSRRRAAQALLGESGIYPEPEKILQECVERLANERAQSRLRDLGRQIRDAETRGDEAATQQFQAEKQRLLEETRRLGRK